MNSNPNFDSTAELTIEMIKELQKKIADAPFAPPCGTETNPHIIHPDALNMTFAACSRCGRWVNTEAYAAARRQAELHAELAKPIEPIPTRKDGNPYPAHSYLTDDRDSPQRKRGELTVSFMPNGDFYISVAPHGEKTFLAVRVCMSGGASSRNPKFAQAVRDLFQSLGGWGETVDDGRGTYDDM